MNLEILYEDDNVLAINKPSGLVVNRAATVKEETIQDWFINRLGEQFFQDEFWQKNPAYEKLIPADFDPEFGQPLEIWRERLGIVHRLDKDTSGVLILAKNPGALLYLLSQFKKRETKKIYMSLVHGKFADKTGHIVAPMSRSVHNRLRFAVDSAGRPAITDFKVIREFNGLNDETVVALAENGRFRVKKVRELYQAGFSLLELEPKTGRTHQIRVHMTAMQHPLVGDQVYAGKKRVRLDAFWCRRQFLHALSLEFTNPTSGEKMTIEAPLATDLEEVLKRVV